MIPDDDEAEHVEDDAANLEAVLEPEEGEEGEAGGEEGEAADVEAPAAEEGEGDAAEGAEDADGNLLFLGIKLVKDINCRICNFCFQAELMVATVVTVATEEGMVGMVEMGGSEQESGQLKIRNRENWGFYDFTVIRIL